MKSNGSMNRIFRVIWNAAKASWQAVSEVASGQGKGTSGKAARLARRGLTLSSFAAGTVLVLALPVQAAPAVDALPTGGVVTDGAATISSSGSRMDINQTTQRTAIDWQTFNIGSAAHVHFEQPAGGVALNRVLDTNASQIYGRLTATGQVFLVNPNGVLFAPGAQVDVGGLVASTLNISNADFMAGNYKFEGTSSNAIINQGNITAAAGGTIALIAAKITNDGTLTANGGNVLLGAGSKVTLDMGGPVKLQIENDTLETLIQNGGVIKADGGVVWLTSQAANNLASSVINNTGLIEAQTLATGEKGEIILFAHDGQMNVGGTLKAEGGFIETSGKEFAVMPGATVIAEDWLIDPVDIEISMANGLVGAIETALGTTNVTISTAGGNTPDTAAGESGTEGNITVSDDVTWVTDKTLTLRADNNISVNANINHGHASAGGVIFLYGQATGGGGNSTYTATGTVTSPSVQWRKGSDANSTRYAIVGGNFFLGNKYIELGMCGSSAAAIANCTSGGSKSGKFGTSNMPSLFFGRSSGSGIGMVGDADGFGVGTDLRIDYFLPGTPAEQFSSFFTGASGTATNFATAANSGTFAFEALGADGTITLKYSAVQESKLKIEQAIALKPDELEFTNTVTLTNVDAASLDGVRFARSFDPDNTVDKDGVGGYSNTQKIELTLAAGDAANVVSATSAASGAYYTASGNKTAKILYSSSDASTQVGHGGAFFSGSDMNAMVTAANALSKGNSATADAGIGIIYNAGTMAAGASKSFTYKTILDNRDIATILGTAATTTTTTTINTIPQDTAISSVQSTVLPPVVNTTVPSNLVSPVAPPPTVVLSNQGTLPVFDVNGGLAFVQVSGPTAGNGTTLTTGLGGGTTDSGSGNSQGGSGNGAGGQGNGLPGSADSGGRDPFGFMRVFVVNGGLNLPDVALGALGQNRQNDANQ